MTASIRTWKTACISSTTRLIRLKSKSTKRKPELLTSVRTEFPKKNIYQFLLYFNEFYDRFNDAEKKEFLNCFIERVDIYEQEQPDGRFLKHIKFRFPVFFDGKETEELSRDNETTLESVALLARNP